MAKTRLIGPPGRSGGANIPIERPPQPGARIPIERPPVPVQPPGGGAPRPGPGPGQQPPPGRAPTWSQPGSAGFQAQQGRYQQLKAGGNEARLTDWLKSRGGKSGQARAAFEGAGTPPVPPPPAPMVAGAGVGGGIPPSVPSGPGPSVGIPEPGLGTQFPGGVRGGPLPPQPGGAPMEGLISAGAAPSGGAGAPATEAGGLGMPSLGLGAPPMLQAPGQLPSGVGRAGFLGQRIPPSLESALMGLMAAKGRVF